MVWPLQPSPLGGNLGATTCSIFRLDPLGLMALEPLVDLVPGVSPLRVTFDMVDGEQASFDYDVTEHAIQSFLDVTSNVRKRLETISVTGFLGAMPPFLGSFAPPSIPGLRLDLIRIANLKSIADARSPVMVVTPRIGLAKAFITSISQPWSPSDGESTVITVTFREARLVSPITGDLIPDFPSQAPGNNAVAGGGQVGTSAAGQTATPSATPGVAPTVGGGA